MLFALLEVGAALRVGVAPHGMQMGVAQRSMAPSMAADDRCALIDLTAVRHTSLEPLIIDAPSSSSSPLIAARLSCDRGGCVFVMAWMCAQEEPKRVAQVLKKAWMEGGVKRGLVGTVFVLEDQQKVQIACQGPVERLKSFADWIENSSMLCVTKPLKSLWWPSRASRSLFSI